jgi:uncharacterized protein
MKKKSFLLLFITGVLLLFAACSSSSSSGESSSGNTTNLALGTGGTSGTYYIIGSGMSTMFQKHEPSIKLGVEVTAGGMENSRLLFDGNVDAIFVDPIAVKLFGEEEDIGEFRQISAGHGMFMHIMVKADSDVNSVSDLKGKKVGVGAAGSGNAIGTEEILGIYNMSFDDIEPLYLSFAEQVDAFKSGQIDAMFIMAGTPTSAIVDIETTEKIKFLGIEDQKLDEVDQIPGMYSTTLPKGTYKTNQNEDINGVGTNTQLVVRSDMDDELVYKYVKTMHENWKTIEESHPSGAEWDQSADHVFRGSVIPFHPAAIKYFKEVGIWDEAENYGVKE